MPVNDGEKQWHQQPLVWLIIAIPFIAVVGGVSLLIFSLSIDDGVVVDDYYKKGKEINRVLKRDRKAAAMGIRGVATYTAENQRFSVALASSRGAAIDAENIRLQLFHATRGGMDVNLPLTMSGAGVYQATLEQALALGPWHVQVGNHDWRVRGRIHIPDQYTAPLSAQ